MPCTSCLASSRKSIYPSVVRRVGLSVATLARDGRHHNDRHCEGRHRREDADPGTGRRGPDSAAGAVPRHAPRRARLAAGHQAQGLGRRPEARTPDAARPVGRPGGDLPLGRAYLSHGDPAVTAEFDPAMPNMARVYDYWLSGKDNYPADRAEAERLLAIYPPLRDLVRENRAFVTQAVSWAARQSIGQFIDLGAGLPACPPVHQAVRKVMPPVRVAYVDIDPVVLSHARALLATSDGVTAVAADLRDPGAVLADPELRAVIDPARPVCVILGAVLHFLDADAARTVTAGYKLLT